MKNYKKLQGKIVELTTKVRSKGLFLSIKIIIHRLKNKFNNIIERFSRLKILQENKFTVIFENEGNIKIKMPVLNYSYLFFPKGHKIDKEFDFSSRSNKESLLRKVVYELFQKNYLSPDKSIIDIGCWLSDNTLVWAKLLSKGGFVHAIDPSSKNLEFGKELATLNGIQNINWVEAVCSDHVNQLVEFSGSIEHARFSETEIPNLGLLYSRTLDDIVWNTPFQDISLLHVDVEGFEKKVLKGAEKIIEKSKPVVLFEQHISQDNVLDIVEFLKKKNYTVFMINEVLPGCSLDCRNFIAFDSNRLLPSFDSVRHYTGRSQNIWYASLQDAIIPVK